MSRCTFCGAEKNCLPIVRNWGSSFMYSQIEEPTQQSMNACSDCTKNLSIATLEK